MLQVEAVREGMLVWAALDIAYGAEICSGFGCVFTGEAGLEGELGCGESSGFTMESERFSADADYDSEWGILKIALGIENLVGNLGVIRDRDSALCHS